MDIAVAWSGGKDSCFAYHKALSAGNKVKFLLNLKHNNSDNVAFHTVDSGMIRGQSKAVNLPLIERSITPQKVNKFMFEEELDGIIKDLRKHKIGGLVVGYTHEDYQRIVLKRLCSKHRIKLIEPLFNRSSKEIIKSIIDLGFKAVITEVLKEKMHPSWVGKAIDKSFYSYLTRVAGVDFCGDFGEYHTFVVDGPVFKQRIKIFDSGVVDSGTTAFLKIKKHELIPKK